jgi:hypothetical protein
MKYLMKRLFLGLIGFLLVYLLTAFYNVSFDVSKWDELSRLICVLVGGFLFFVMAVMPNDNFK